MMKAGNRSGIFSGVKRMFNSTGSLVALFFLVVFLSIASDRFLSLPNLMNIARQSSINGFVALGVMLTILTAGIDLSVGSTLAFSGAVLGISIVKWGVSPATGILLCIVTGVGIGLINGLLLTKLHLPHPFISTLGTMNIFRGLTLIVMRATPISGMPDSVRFIGSKFIGPIPISFIFLLLMYTYFHFFLTNTTTGRYIYGVGGDKDVAHLSGINVDKVLIIVYALSGFMAAVGSLVLAGRVNAVYPLAGDKYEMDAIASCIIGGTSFFGGKGTVWGTLIGALIMGIIRNGLNLLNVSASAQTVTIGTIIIVAVYADVLRQQKFSRVK
ncbi:MAG: ABC transporter permease [Bacteroidetes bacterium]|nr:ABC transporter permease [Bacteroidota bacterium]